MSAFYSFRYPDRVQLLTDGAHFDENGNLIGVGGKVFISSHFPMAITSRGTAAVSYELLANLEYLTDTMVSVTSVDEMLDVTRWYFSGLKEQGRAFNSEFLIAAFSEEHGPCHFYVHCHGHRDLQAFELLDLGEQICGGSSAISWQDLAHLNLGANDLASPDFPETYGIDIMNALRRQRGTVPGSDLNIFMVGGRCDLTTVTAAGAASKTLCNWDDQIGKPIDPTRGLLPLIDEIA